MVKNCSMSVRMRGMLEHYIEGYLGPRAHSMFRSSAIRNPSPWNLEILPVKCVTQGLSFDNFSCLMTSSVNLEIDKKL